MRARRVDDPDLAGGIDQRHRLARRVVGQAEDGEVGLVERLAPRGGVLAPGFVERDELKFAAAGEPVADFEPGGARGAVDEHGLRHGSGSSRSTWM
jgi:hypothetical protein